MGDLELPLGDKKEAFHWIRQGPSRDPAFQKISNPSGGDHLITLPVIEEVLRVYPDLHLIHIDAHADLREDYLGETLSHSTVMRKILTVLDREDYFR